MKRAAASGALLRHEAVLAQTAGDAVMAIFVPGLAGATYRTSAVAAGRGVHHGREDLAGRRRRCEQR